MRSSTFLQRTRQIALVFLYIALLLCERSIAYEFAGGTGEPNDPYQIATAWQFAVMVFDCNAHYVLIDDIDGVIEIQDILLGQFRDFVASRSGTLDKSVLLQHMQRIPDRAPADSPFLGDFGFINDFTGL